MLAEGLALHKAGRIADAERLYGRVLLMDPNNARANDLVGLTYLQAGKVREAVSHMSRACELDPANPQFFCNLGVAQNAAGEPESAILSFTRAIELKPDYAEAYANRGMALKVLRRAGDAAENHRRAIALKPDEAGFHLNLGNTLTELGDLHEAEREYREALRLRPGYPAALSGLTLTLTELGRAEEAIAVGEAVVGRHPRRSDYLRALGLAQRAAGRTEAAAASFRNAVSLDPDDMTAFRHLSTIVRRESHDAEMERLAKRFEEPSLDNGRKAELAFALGEWFRDLGEYERSFNYFSEGNRLQRLLGPYSVERAVRDFELIARLFKPLPNLPERGTGGPIFVVGLPRAGKTTLEGMLARHSQIRPVGELRILALLIRDLMMEYRLVSEDRSLSSVPARAFEVLGEKYRAYVKEIAGDGIPVDTMPGNFRNIGFIRRALPDAVIINCVRDPFRQWVEIFRKYFIREAHRYSNDLRDIVTYYRAYDKLMSDWRQLFPEFILDVDSSALLSSPDRVMKRVLAHCQLPFEDRCTVRFQSEPRLGNRQLQDEAEMAPYRRELAFAH